MYKVNQQQSGLRAESCKLTKKLNIDEVRSISLPLPLLSCSIQWAQYAKANTPSGLVTPRYRKNECPIDVPFFVGFYENILAKWEVLDMGSVGLTTCENLTQHFCKDANHQESSCCSGSTAATQPEIQEGKEGVEEECRRYRD